MCIRVCFFFKISNGWKYSLSFRFPLFPFTPNPFHFKYVKVKNCTQIITMFFSRSSKTRALKFRYKLNIKRKTQTKQYGWHLSMQRAVSEWHWKVKDVKVTCIAYPFCTAGIKTSVWCRTFHNLQLVFFYAIASYRKNRTGFALLLYSMSSHEKDISPNLRLLLIRWKNLGSSFLRAFKPRLKLSKMRVLKHIYLPHLFWAT